MEAGGMPEDRKAALLAEFSRIIGNRAFLRRVLNNLEEVSGRPTETPAG
jgi:hypothetical protein